MLKNILKPLLLSLLPALFFQACGDKDRAGKSYTITYDLNGGTGAAPASQTFKTGANAVALPDGTGLTKKGFAFGGWAEKADAKVPVSNPYTPSSNVTLYVIWNPVYLVTYHINGGSGTVPPPQTFTQEGTSLTSGLTLNDGKGLTRTGFTFGGWSETADGKTALVSPYKPSRDVTVYAVWNAVSYTVTYHINEGTGTTPTPQTYTQGNPTGLTLNDGAGLSKAGFTFGGWSETATGKSALVSPYKPLRDMTVYAIWNAVAATYTVTYNINEGTGTTPTPQTYTQGNPTGLTLNDGAGLSKAGFTFGGWSETATGKSALVSPYKPLRDMTVYAIWNAAATYTVTYNINEGTGTTPASQTYTQGNPTGLTLNDGAGLSKTGFTFGGWSETATGKSALVSPYKPSRDMTVYAIWNAAATYTVTYNINEGTGTTPTPQTYTQGNPTGLTLNDGAGLSKTGFTFGGWSETATGKSALVSPYKPLRDMTVYAIWNAAAATYTVTYNINEGTGTTPTPQTYTQGNPTGLTLNNGAGLSKTGFTFGGWSETATGKSALVSPYKPLRDMTVYAIWNAAATYTVTYNINEGTGTTPASQTYTQGNPTGLTLNDGAGLSKTGFTFGGWSETATGKSALVSPYKPSRDMTVYAIWNAAATYTVTYNINEGTGTTPTPQTYTQGNPTGLTLNNGAGLSKMGFTFGGWSETATGKSALVSPYKPLRDMTVYAIWNAAATYTVTYNINEGTGTTPASQTYTQGNPTGLTLNDGAGLSKTGFTFGGWSETATGKSALVSPYKPLRDMTVYAIWNAAAATTYTVTYNVNGGSGTAPASQTYTQGNTGLTLNDGAGLSRTGYTFRGWVTTATGTTVLTGPYSPNADITLYAYWQQNVASAFTLSSASYTNGGTIPDKCSSGRDKPNTSPQLSWTGAPSTDVVKYILVFYDETVTFWHFRREIDTNVSNLAEGAIPSGFSGYDYYGPEPPPGELHTYEFKLYAVKSGYTLANFGGFSSSQKSWADLETANSAFIVGSSNIYSGTYTGIIR